MSEETSEKVADMLKCDGEKMQEVLDKMKSLEEILLNTYSLAIAVKEEIESKTNWDGESQLTMCAFMDLLTQYHKDFVIGEEVPIPSAIKHLEKLQSNLDVFYENWEEYEVLKTI
ncbi:hypothetical protein [Anaerosporobacter sp.]